MSKRTELENIMYEEAINEVEEMGKMELGSEAHLKTAKVVKDTVDSLNEAKKIENQTRQLDIEEERNEIEREKIKVDKRKDLIKNIVTGVTFALSTGVMLWLNKDAQRFEIGGNIHTTEAGKSSTRKLFNLLDNFK